LNEAAIAAGKNPPPLVNIATSIIFAVNKEIATSLVAVNLNRYNQEDTQWTPDYQTTHNLSKITPNTVNI
jgi:hypothetical protein